MGKKDKKIEQLQDDNDQLAIELKLWQEKFGYPNGIASEVYTLRMLVKNQVDMIKKLRDKLMEQDTWIQKANVYIKDFIPTLEQASKDYGEFSEALTEQIDENEKLKELISVLKAENNSLREKLTIGERTPLDELFNFEKKSERQRDIEDKAYSFHVLVNAFGSDDESGKTLIDYIIGLDTENKILNAQLDLVPYQLEKQRELCAKTYEYWANVFSLPIKCDDIPKHISHHIKTTRVPTPDDLGTKLQDEEPQDEGMTYPGSQV